MDAKNFKMCFVAESAAKYKKYMSYSSINPDPLRVYLRTSGRNNWFALLYIKYLCSSGKGVYLNGMHPLYLPARFCSYC